MFENRFDGYNKGGFRDLKELVYNKGAFGDLRWAGLQQRRL